MTPVFESRHSSLIVSAKQASFSSSFGGAKRPPELVTDLPCLDSSDECIDLLTDKAIANSPELETLEARIGLLDRRLGLAGESINYAESKLWTNYIPDSFSPNPLNIINPFSWIKNIFGGGDIQRSRIAIADLELKKANVEAQRAELERRYAEVESKTKLGRKS